MPIIPIMLALHDDGIAWLLPPASGWPAYLSGCQIRNHSTLIAPTIHHGAMLQPCGSHNMRSCYRRMPHVAPPPLDHAHAQHATPHLVATSTHQQVLPTPRPMCGSQPLQQQQLPCGPGPCPAACHHWSAAPPPLQPRCPGQPPLRSHPQTHACCQRRP